MNDPPSDVSEGIIDIFILSVSETVTSLFTEHLEKKGYRVTIFTDGRYLLESLREGKPNLLICDTTTLDEEGFEICRQIKTDDDFWVIPVLILTSGSNLTDLLQILDCNADNFITHPFDLSYCLSVIDSMLSIPVERQTPDQIKTQFKISHNEQIYVVAANRRKLLEFLLSSFEITVTQSSELSRIKSELQILSESANVLEERVSEQTRVIESIYNTIQQKEQKISALTQEVGGDKKIIAQKTELIAHLSGELDDARTLLATSEENLQTSIQERKDTESSLQSEIDTLLRQIGDLSTEIDTTKTSLETVQGELEDEKIHGTSLECTLELLVPQKEQAEKNLHALTLEHDQLKSAFDNEKNRALTAEQEIEKISQEKTRAEQVFTTKINTLDEEIKHQLADLALIKDELESEKDKRISLENTSEAFRLEKNQLESSLQSLISLLKEQLGDLQEKYESTQQALEAEKGKTTSLEENLASVVAEKENNLQTLTLEYDQLKSAFDEEKNRALTAEQKIEKINQEKTRAEEELNLAITRLNETVKQQTGELAELKSAFDEEKNRALTAEQEIEKINQEKIRAEEELNLAITRLNEAIKQQTGELAELESALDTEKNRGLTAEQELGKIQQEKTRAEEELNLAITGLNETVKEQSRELKDLKSAFDEETRKQAFTAEQEIEKIKQEKTRAEEELNLAIKELNETVKQQTGELKKLKSELEDEAQKRISSENRAEAIQQEKLQSESSLSSAMITLKEQVGDLQNKYESARDALETEQGRTKSLKENLADIVSEKDNIEDLLKTDRESYRATFLRLKHDLDAATAAPASREKELIALKSQNKSLSDELNLAYQAKAQAAQQVHSLTEEVEQAKAQLASEQGLHRARDEIYSTDKQNVQRMEQDLRKLSDERASLDKILENERRLRQDAEAKIQEAAQKQELLEQELRVINDKRTHHEDEGAIKLQNLEKEYGLVRDLQKSLEAQVNILKKEKLQSEKTIGELTHELDQARTALADEWEDHMISVAAAYKERQRLQQSSSPAAEGGVNEEKSVVTSTKKPDLPVVVEPASQALVETPPHEIQIAPVSEKDLTYHEPKLAITEISPNAINDIVNNFGDEDFSENVDPVTTKPDGAPKPTGVSDHGPEKTGENSLNGSPVSATEYGEEVSGDDDLADVDEAKGDEYSTSPPDDTVSPLSHGFFSFDRRQWFEIIKWARHSGALSHDQRVQVLRMGRLIQKNRKLTKKQEDQVNEMIALVEALGYRPS